MNDWPSRLRDELRRLEHQGLRRSLRPRGPGGSREPGDPAHAAGRFVHIAGQRLLNLASNDYLALAGHPRLRDAAVEAVRLWGVGSGASRLVTGDTDLHTRVERRFAAFKHAEAALLLPTGYMANLAVLTTLAGPGDLICVDKLNHASLLDAARFSGATVRVYPHGNLAKLQRLLAASRNADRSSPIGNRFIVTDAVFSMDGDTADLPALCDLADRHDAVLMVDEAHATGVLGETGAGLCEQQGVADRVDIVVSTASKALGGLGGVITAGQVVIDTLINRARPFIYTTAAPPAQAAAIGAALDVVRDEPWRRQRVIELSRRVRQAVAPDTQRDIDTPIIPIIAGSPQAALALADHLRRHNIHAPAIRPPTVPPGTSRVRLCLRADLEDEDVNHVLETLRKWNRAAP